MKKCELSYEDIVSLENLCAAWGEFVVGKRKKVDVCEFQFQLMDQIMSLHEDLVSRTYCHGTYHEFRIADPKPRVIHKASVRDRLLHHAIHRKLYPFFDRLFIADSYACRNKKGLHRAINRFRRMSWKVSKNHTQTCWVLKCDIRKFFASVDHRILLDFLDRRIADRQIHALLSKVVFSFQTSLGRGIPLGNLTSQLFANVYLNELDQYMKHELGCNFYIRYADDFVILDSSQNRLNQLIPHIDAFVSKRLALSLHRDKIAIKCVASGIDFLGWVHFPRHRVIRNVTQKRMFRRLAKQPKNETLQSYLGLLGHGNTYELQCNLRNQYWLYWDICV